MTSIKLNVTEAAAEAHVCGILTSGMVGIQVKISCDKAWEGLIKALVCRAGEETRTVLNVDNAAVVAHEVMIAGCSLFLGLEGRNADGTLVIPTVWAYCGMICSGANADADPTADPTPPIWAQLQAEVEALKKGVPGGGVLATYDETTGELTITGSSVTYNEDTGELAI